MADGVLKMDKSTVMHEGRHEGGVTQGCGAEHVAVVRVSGDLFEAEILVRAGAIECYVTERRDDLRDADDVLSEVTKHLVGLASYAMALHAFGFAEEEQRPFLLTLGKRVLPPARETVERGVGKDQGELELGDGLAKMIEVDRGAGSNIRKHIAEELAVLPDGVQTPEHLVTDGEVISGKIEAGDLDS